MCDVVLCCYLRNNSLPQTCGALVYDIPDLKKHETGEKVLIR